MIIDLLFHIVYGFNRLLFRKNKYLIYNLLIVNVFRKRFHINIIQLTILGFIVQYKHCNFTKKIRMNLTQEDWVSQYEADETAVILDVRTEAEFSEGIIAKAINIDIQREQGFVTEIEALDKNKNYYVYCRSGMRSAKACEIMNQLGFENAYNLIGGIIEWDGEVVEP